VIAVTNYMFLIFLAFRYEPLGGSKMTYRVVVRKNGGNRDCLENIFIDDGIILKWILEEWDGRA
jgi:hypothetical protein